jgi:hypothetical protein
VLHQSEDDISDIDKQIGDEQEHMSKLQFATTPVTKEPDEIDPDESDDETQRGEG